MIMKTEPVHLSLNSFSEEIEVYTISPVSVCVSVQTHNELTDWANLFIHNWEWKWKLCAGKVAHTRRIARYISARGRLHNRKSD